MNIPSFGFLKQNTTKCFRTPFLARRLCNMNINLEQIEKNIEIRQHNESILNLKNLLSSSDPSQIRCTNVDLLTELRKLPNSTNPRLLNYGMMPKLVSCHFGMNPVNPLSKFPKFCTLRMDHLGNLTGHKSYYLKREKAALEQAIIKYAINLLKTQKFKIVAVPDMLNRQVIEDCGMSTDNKRTQVYKLDCKKYLSGTAEMALAGLFCNKILEKSDLPLKLAAVSRCFRAETSGLQEEKNIYRVHQFTKVEMFAVCTEMQSDMMLKLFKDIQIKLYKNLLINFRLLDMPPSELGASAFEKFDIEAWLADRLMWGEISSCSNCTDYQASRLKISTLHNNEPPAIIHTVNGTAAAIPRLIIALEGNFGETGNHNMSSLLHLFMDERKTKFKQKIPGIKLLKCIPNNIINNIYNKNF